MSAQCVTCRQRPAAGPDGKCSVCARTSPDVAGAATLGNGVPVPPPLQAPQPPPQPPRPPQSPPAYGWAGTTGGGTYVPPQQGAPAPYGYPAQPGGPVPPPGAAYPVPYVVTGPPAHFSGAQGLSTALSVLLGIAIAIWGLGIIGGIRMVNVVNDLQDYGGWATIDWAEADDALDFWQGTAAFQGLGLLAIGIVFIVWFHRCRVNAEVFDPVGQRLGRGWAIGSWFVPVVCLWFPKQIANDIWRSSTPWGGDPRLGPVTSWWTLWLCTALTSFAPFAAGDDDEYIDWDELDSTEFLSYVSVLNGISGIVASVLAIRYVRQLTLRQYVKFTQGPGPQGPQPYGPQGGIGPVQPMPYR
ncbi:DUF4328 domain-containing protein [Streptomyces sp. RFCAC02]|uniref:DUF4328 domain-containing protein n=1 Tax=Streptomyces sp. RFCAC02 TaxID=2499143 RepID=UPI001F0F2C33|nr:DUF4328 domain-containing protein [Streptomyces sp. RFCAC02]